MSVKARLARLETAAAGGRTHAADGRLRAGEDFPPAWEWDMSEAEREALLNQIIANCAAMVTDLSQNRAGGEAADQAL